MILIFSQGRIVANQHELVIRLEGTGKVTLQARADDIRLLRQPNIITATGSGVQWMIHNLKPCRTVWALPLILTIIKNDVLFIAISRTFIFFEGYIAKLRLMAFISDRFSTESNYYI